MGLPEVPLRNWVLSNPVTGEVLERLMTKDWVRYFRTTSSQIDTNQAGVASNKTKLDGYINVVSQGATGDGSTDDTSAIQAAITACPEGGMVYVPPCAPGKFYKLTDTISVDKSIRIVGSGYRVGSGSVDGAVLQQTGSGRDVFACAGVEGLVIEHLALGGTGNASSALSLSGGIKRSVFNDLFIPGVGQTGISVSGPGNELNTYASVRIQSGVAGYGSTVRGIAMEGGPSLWSNCSVEGASIGIALSGQGTWIGLRLIGCPVGILWSSETNNIGNTFINASSDGCDVVHSVLGVPTQRLALSIGDGSGDNAFALPSTVGVNLRATQTTEAPVVPLLASEDPVLLAPSTESVTTRRARLDLRDFNAEEETGTSYGGPLVVENTPRFTRDLKVTSLAAPTRASRRQYASTRKMVQGREKREARARMSPFAGAKRSRRIRRRDF